jgi:hypothetical protein
METVNPDKPRTLQQNKALHKYLAELASALNSAGLDMKAVLKPNVDIPWNQDMAKEFLWRPIQKAMQFEESTADLSTTDIQAVYAVLDRHISEKFGVHIEWPSEERMMFEQASRDLEYAEIEREQNG